MQKSYLRLLGETHTKVESFFVTLFFKAFRKLRKEREGGREGGKKEERKKLTAQNCMAVKIQSKSLDPAQPDSTFHA